VRKAKIIQGLSQHPNYPDPNPWRPKEINKKCHDKVNKEK